MKSKFFLKVEKLSINTERMMDLETTIAAITTVIINSCKKHRWMSKQVGGSGVRNTVSKYLPTKHLLIQEGKYFYNRDTRQTPQS